MFKLSWNKNISNRSITKLGVALFALSVLVPMLVFWHGGTTLTFMELKAINGCCLGFSYLIVSYAWISRAASRSKEELFIAITFCVSAAFLLASVNNCSVRPSFDFLCIQNAAGNVLQGHLPYGEDTGYVLYPPLYAESLAWFYRGLQRAGNLLHWNTQPGHLFNLLFYLFQNAQTLAVLTLLYLSQRFAIDSCKMQKVAASLLACLLVALNYPVYGTLQWTQVNVFLTCLVLFVLVFPTRMEAGRGLALAIGIHLKGYPALLLPPLLLARQWRVCAWSIFWTALLYAITLIGFGQTIWSAYLDTARTFIAHITAAPPSYMVNGSNLFSTVFMVAHILKSFGVQHLPPKTVFSIASTIRLLLGAWFGWRILSRHLFERSSADAALRRSTNFLDDCCDMLSFGLLAGPTTLNHHYVLAIPIMLWTIARAGLRAPYPVAIGSLLMTNFQSTITKLMFLSPIGLIMLAVVRSGQNRQLAVAHQDQSINDQKRSAAATRDKEPAALLH